MRTSATGGPKARNVQPPELRASSPLKLAGLPKANDKSGNRTPKLPPRPHSSQALRTSSRPSSGISPETTVLPPATAANKNSGPPQAPKSHSECTETCYWRWLVHMLLEDVALLKANVDSAQDEFLEQVKERKRLEQTVASYANLQVAHKTLEVELGTLNEEAPGLFDEREKLQEELEELESSIEDLQVTKESLEATAFILHEKRKKSEKKLRITQTEAEELRGSVNAAETNLTAVENDKERLTIELKDTKKEAAELREFVDMIEKGKKGKKGKSISPKR